MGDPRGARQRADRGEGDQIGARAYQEWLPIEG
jgi:hypothetical protein